MDQAAIIIKTLLTMILVGACVIASFYAAYVFVVLIVMGVVGTFFYAFYNRERIMEWLEEED